MNIWYESRLLEEGIEDMQNLATANIVDVMLRTRIPVDRLVDWIDQAYLYLHLWPEKGEKDDITSWKSCSTCGDMESAQRRTWRTSSTLAIRS